MKTIRFISIPFLAILLLSGCNNHQEEDIVLGGTPVPVTFNASIVTDALAKKLMIGLEAKDTIGVFMLQKTNEIVTNKKHTTTDGISYTPSDGNDIFHPNDGNSVNFIAYYPYKNDQTLNTYKIDVSDQTDPHAIDLLYSNNATNIAGGQQAVDIGFRHILSKVALIVEKGNDISGEEFTNLNIKFAGISTKADFDLSAGTLSKGTDVADITLKKGIDIYEANVIPQEAGAKILFTLPDNTTITHTFTESFKSGRQYTYKITVNKTSIIVKMIKATEWRST